MAGTVTATWAPVKQLANGRVIQKLSIAWTCTAGGAADLSIDNLKGWLVKVVTNPDDSQAPTDNYDITLVDANGVDAAQGKIIDRDTATSEEVYTTPTGASVPVLLDGTYTFTVANAGNAKSGVCELHITEQI